MLVAIYRKYIPADVRQVVYESFLKEILIFIRNFKINLKCKLIFIFKKFLPKSDYYKAMAFMGKNGLTAYPDEYMLEYSNFNVEVNFDSIKQLYFVKHNNRKLFFASRFNKEQIIKLYKSLIIEQDYRCAHRYVGNYEDLRGLTLLDIGSAEGIFTLDNIERVNHAYLFEVESYWIDALKATFEPWRNKVTIVEKYVGSNISEYSLTIDSFLMGKEKENIFIKMDIEGAEEEALIGAKDILSAGKNIQLAICTYHNPKHPHLFESMLHHYGFRTEFTNGYLYWGKRLSKAVIRGQK